jgi:hypothetical protein
MGTTQRLRINKLVTPGTMGHWENLNPEKSNRRIGEKYHKIENVSQFKHKA